MAKRVSPFGKLVLILKKWNLGIFSYQDSARRLDLEALILAAR